MSLLARRRAMMGAEQAEPGLPAEYQQVEWIQNSSEVYPAKNNYIVTDVLANPTTRADFKLMKLVKSTAGPMIISSGKTSPFGALDNSQSAYVCTPSYTVSQGVNEILEVSFTKSISGSGYVTLLSWVNGAYCCGIRCYYAKIYHGSTMVFDGVPVYRKADGAIGLFNLVTQTFCAGTSIYTKGPDVL